METERVFRAALPLLVLAHIALEGAFGGMPTRAVETTAHLPNVAPLRPLVDHPGVLQSDTKAALESLLTEHQRLTGERIVFAVFRTSSGVAADEKARELFQVWELNSRKTRGNSVLLVLFWKEREAHLETGYGLDSVLSQDEANHIISDFLMPDLESSGPNRALPLALFELLKALESPLIANGEAERTLRDAGFTGDWTPECGRAEWLWILGFLFSGVLLAFTIFWLSSAEVHLSRYGMFRLRPWELVNWRKPLIKMGILRAERSGSIRSNRIGGGGTFGKW